jgi:tetratricopeptide (TPR) repeat protein
MMRPPLRWLIGGAAAAVALGATLPIPRRWPTTAAAAASADTAITSRSIAYFERRLAAQPANYMVRSRLMSRYVRRFTTGANLADVARAEANARELVRTGPDRVQALSRLSSVLLMQHKFAGALAAASEARDRDSSSQEALGALFDASLAAGRYADAESALGRLRPGTLDAQVRRAQWLDASGQTQAAFDGFDRICHQLQRSEAPPPVVAWCLTQLGAVDHARRGPEAAAAVWNRALAVQPGYRGALEGLASLAQAQGNLRRAERLYRRIAADAHPDLYLRLSEIAGARGDSARAREYERRFLALAGDPANEALYGELLALYYAEQDAPARVTALTLARRAVARRPTVESYDVLSWVRFRRHELTEAFAASDSARRWGTPSPTMDWHRGRILEALGRNGEATPLLQAAAARRTLLAPHARRDLDRRE